MQNNILLLIIFMSKKLITILLIILGVVLVSVILCLLIIVATFFMYGTTKEIDVLPVYPDGQPTPIITEYEIQEPSIVPTEPSSDGMGNYNPAKKDEYRAELAKLAPFKLEIANPVENKEISPIYRPELDLLIRVLDLTQSGKDFPGGESSGGNNVIVESDFDLNQVRDWKSRWENDLNKVAIPKDLENLFKTDTAQEDIKRIAFKAREEFIEALKIYGVDSKLIEELDKNVFPPDEDHLWISTTDNIYAEFSFVTENASEKTDRRDISEAYMRYEMGSAFSNANRINQSGLLGVEPTDPAGKQEYWKKARELGIRIVFFHEMVHVLQIAYRNEVAKTLGPDKLFGYEKLDVGMEGFMSERLFWPETVFEVADNFTILMEAQGGLLAHHLVVNMFDMNEIQENALWNFTGGGKRVSLVRPVMEEIKGKLVQNDLYLKEPYYFQRKSAMLSGIFTDPSIKEFIQKIEVNTDRNSLASYAGYIAEYDYEEISKVFENLTKAPAVRE